jgi:hypothetical protein
MIAKGLIPGMGTRSFAIMKRSLCREARGAGESGETEPMELGCGSAVPMWLGQREWLEG